MTWRCKGLVTEHQLDALDSKTFADLLIQRKIVLGIDSEPVFVANRPNATMYLYDNRLEGVARSLIENRQFGDDLVSVWFNSYGEIIYTTDSGGNGQFVNTSTEVDTSSLAQIAWTILEVRNERKDVFVYHNEKIHTMYPMGYITPTVLLGHEDIDGYMTGEEVLRRAQMRLFMVNDDWDLSKVIPTLEEEYVGNALAFLRGRWD